MPGRVLMLGMSLLQSDLGQRDRRRFDDATRALQALRTSGGTQLADQQRHGP